MRTIRSGRSAGPRPLLFLVLAAGLILAACAGAGASLSTVGNQVDGDGGSRDAGAGAPAPSGAPDDGGNAVGTRDDALIIRTGSLDLEVGDVAASVRAARDAVRALGGYVGASRTGDEGDRPFAQVTYRIPSDRWEDALDALRAIGGPGTRVVAERTEAVEVTGQVVDLEARIRNLRASESALQAIAERATQVSDVLEVQAQLTNVRGEIERLDAQRTDLVERVAYATLTTSFTAPIVAVATQAEAWDPAAVVDSATASLIGVLQGLAALGIWIVIVILPMAVMAALLIAVALVVLRRLGKAARPVG